jgi:hypothetical protein
MRVFRSEKPSLCHFSLLDTYCRGIGQGDHMTAQNVRLVPEVGIPGDTWYAIYSHQCKSQPKGP